MLRKLSLRNARRAAKDYVVYMITMTIFAALMFAFNSMLLSRDIANLSDDVPMMAIMLGLATFFIVIIIAWLIRYMITFMLENRSREFGAYLLLGMHKKQISRLFFRENLVMGSLAFLLGLGFGLFLKLVLMSVFYSLIGHDYHFNLDLNPFCFLITGGIYYGCYLLALLRSKRKFRKMNIIALMNVNKQNQQIREKGDVWKQWLFFLAIGYLLFYYFLMFSGSADISTLLLLTIGIAFAVYLIYLGIASFVVRYIKKKRKGIYNNGNLFLLRQFSAKIKTMPFTMGTLTVLFIFAILSMGIAMMFGDYLNKQLPYDFPFDISAVHENPDEDFAELIALADDELKILDSHRFAIWQNGADEMNMFLYTNLHLFRDKYKNPDGSPNRQKIIDEQRAYHSYDTFMKLSDYNYQRKMLDLGEVKLESGQYIIQLPNRVYREVKDKMGNVPLIIDGEIYQFKGFMTDRFAQDGHNGADYVIVVPDDTVGLEPYYGRIVITVADKKASGLQERLDPWFKIADNEEGPAEETFFDRGFGTKQILIYSSEVLVRADVEQFLKYLLNAMVFPLFYIAMVYLCVALTVLSVQQLSDSAKYKFRYAVLKKLGLNQREIDKLIWKQLLWYYLCPILAAVFVSAVIILTVSDIFVRNTGVNTMVGYYFGFTVMLLLGIYMLYFLATYVLFKRAAG
ncbi:MAG: FtsX-like permease family protein [Lachnospiraceae bacterium]|nr:FtsX-like permease family protein [Lachnospiraceae bacterium]